MMTGTFLTFSDGSTKKVSKGDIIETVHGQFIFMEMKRTKWVGKGVKDEKLYRIPSQPAVLKSIVGRDDSVVENLNALGNLDLKAGDLFAVESKKLTFMFHSKTKAGKIKAVNVANQQPYTVDQNIEAKKIELAEVKSAM